MTSAPRPDEPGINIYSVRTIEDAAAWLREQAAAYHDQVTSEPSPVKAQALRKTGTTLEDYAEIVAGSADELTAYAALRQVSRDYQHGDRAAELPEDHRLACSHLAETLSHLTAQLSNVTAGQRRRRALGALRRSGPDRSLEL
jgi:hypothetical protein